MGYCVIIDWLFLYIFDLENFNPIILADRLSHFIYCMKFNFMDFILI